MALSDDINLWLRDFAGYSGDGQGGSGALPVGDRSTARYPLIKRDLRYLFMTLAQTMGDPGALQDILDDLDAKAPSDAIKTFALVNVGGTGNAATAEKPAAQADIGMSNGSIVSVVWPETNTGINPTLTIDGTEFAVRRQNGFNIQPEELAGGRSFLFFKFNATTLRLVSASGIPDIFGLTEALADMTTGLNDLNEVLPSVNPSPRLVPLYSDAAGNVPVWLTNGALDGTDMAPGLRDLAVQDVAPKVATSGALVPIMGAGGSVFMWAGPGGVCIPGMARLSDIPSIPARPTITDGRSLHRARMKLAQIAAGVPGAKLKIAGIGDSWWEMPQITRAFRDFAGARTGLSGEGFRPAAGGNTVGPATWARADWTDVDGSSSSPVFTYGAGPDGNGVYSALTTSTMTLTDVVATDIHIYSYQHGGTWRYRLDGGAWSTVTEDASGDFRVTSITGLADAAHTLEIDTVGNAGTVSMAGLYTTRAVNGAEILKFGNGGTRGDRVLGYAQYLTAPMAHMQPDVAVVILGTNDYRSASSPPATYLEALQAIVAAGRAAVPDIGFVFVIPPQTDGSAVTPLSAYRDIVQPWAEAEGLEVVSLLDRWSDYATANAHGLFMDTLHVNALGAGVLTADILTNLILKGH